MGRTRPLVPQVWPAAPGVGLPCLQRNSLDAQAGRCARTKSANVFPRGLDSDRASGKGTCETYLVVCVIRRVKASTTERATVHELKSLCEQDGRLYAHIETFILRTSKRAASGPVPRSS